MSLRLVWLLVAAGRALLVRGGGKDVDVESAARSHLKTLASGPLVPIAEGLFSHWFHPGASAEPESQIKMLHVRLGALMREEGLGDGGAVWTSLREALTRDDLFALSRRGEGLTNASLLELVLNASRPGLLPMIVAELSAHEMAPLLPMNQTKYLLGLTHNLDLALLAQNLPGKSREEKLSSVVAALEPVFVREAYARGTSWAGLLGFAMQITPSLPRKDRLMLVACLLGPRLGRVALALGVCLVLLTLAAQTVTQRALIWAAALGVFFVAPSPIFEWALLLEGLAGLACGGYLRRQQRLRSSPGATGGKKGNASGCCPRKRPPAAADAAATPLVMPPATATEAPAAGARAAAKS